MVALINTILNVLMILLTILYACVMTIETFKVIEKKNKLEEAMRKSKAPETSEQ